MQLWMVVVVVVAKGGGGRAGRASYRAKGQVGAHGLARACWRPADGLRRERADAQSRQVDARTQAGAVHATCPHCTAS